MNAKDTAERIRNLRKARGMSQSQFAAMCGIEQGQLCNYECGRIMPTIPLCERICEAVGLRVIDFLSEDKATKGPIPTERRIGERVKALRLMRGMNQTELAEKSGVADSTISSIERGERYGIVTTYLYLAEALDVSIGELLGGE
jgi:transcriptional regulator with XRE-family HTH domain|nr:MAG TPA: helix-turn-helix domain protein [Caudoviricetes sp.]